MYFLLLDITIADIVLGNFLAMSLMSMQLQTRIDPTGPIFSSRRIAVPNRRDTRGISD